MTITSAFGILTAVEGPSSVLDIFLYAAGAVVAFAAVETLATSGFTHHLEDEPSEVRALGGSISLLSVGSGMGVALAAASLTNGAVAWPLAAFLVTVVYLLGFALELGVAERIRPRSRSGGK